MTETEAELCCVLARILFELYGQVDCHPAGMEAMADGIDLLRRMEVITEEPLHQQRLSDG